VAIENITAQVQDVDISTAHWAQFTFWQPRKSAFYKAATHYNFFFLTKKSDDLTDFLSNHRTFERAKYFFLNEVLQENS
jgi:hypothetical protein